ncbi:MAG TPA: Mrp/NBP35 family ATP-binding protein [Bdellovibrionales bacterium]|mgnify:FL=1|nr:Mrp/NBP35 family ATP-binding protein [Bdellovibrionales bacterium]
MNPFQQQAPIPGVKHVLAVGSGKGGVGKSTVAVNLAMALAKRGRKVGLLDADIYGPSVPRMLGAHNQRPEVNEAKKIQPVLRYGVKTMSLGYLVDEAQAAVWRGPMLFKAMDQFFRDVDWGELDELIIDLPPGTGDVGLTMAQKVPVTGAILVCTPQNVALADAKKALDMFERTNVPVMGVVENMAWLETPAGERVQLYPKGDLDTYLSAKRIPKLAEIPFLTEIGVSSEAGIPLLESHTDDAQARAFTDLASAVLERIPRP